MSEWQPIESAPRDGQRILGFVKYGGPEINVYEPTRYGSNLQFESWRVPYDDEDRAVSPDFWMPLPAPPST